MNKASAVKQAKTLIAWMTATLKAGGKGHYSMTAKQFEENESSMRGWRTKALNGDYGSDVQEEVVALKAEIDGTKKKEKASVAGADDNDGVAAEMAKMKEMILGLQKSIDGNVAESGADDLGDDVNNDSESDTDNCSDANDDDDDDDAAGYGDDVLDVVLDQLYPIVISCAFSIIFYPSFVY